MAFWPIRLVVLCAGFLSFAWSAYSLPILAGQAPLQSVAARIVSREPYRPDALSGFKDGAAVWSRSKWRRPSILAAKATVDLRLLERAIDWSDSRTIGELFAETEAAIQDSLAASPADPFLWVVYFWVENSRRGFKPPHLNDLRMSYETGPNEGWVAVNRGRLALERYQTLPPDLADRAVVEFSRLVASRFYGAAINLLSRQNEPLTSRLLGSLNGVDLDIRESFAKAAYRQGYDWNVPGVEKPEWRPWH